MQILCHVYSCVKKNIVAERCGMFSLTFVQVQHSLKRILDVTSEKATTSSQHQFERLPYKPHQDPTTILNTIKVHLQCRPNPKNTFITIYYFSQKICSFDCINR